MSVFWTRGYRREGNALQMGVVVVRPGWVAFLPLGGPMSPMDQFQLGASRGSFLDRGGGMTPGHALRMDVPWQGRYPLMAWWQHGLYVLDEEVRRALGQPGALMFTTAEAGLVRRKFIPAAFAQNGNPAFITLDQAPPPDLLAPWPPGVMPFDAKSVKKAMWIIAVTLVLFGGACEAIGIGAEGSFQLWPVILWGLLAVVLPLGGYWLRSREHRADLAAQQTARTVGPYR